MCRIRIQILLIVNRNVLFNTLRHKNIKHQDYFNNFVKKMGYVHMKLQLPKYTTSQVTTSQIYNFPKIQLPKLQLLKYAISQEVPPKIWSSMHAWSWNSQLSFLLMMIYFWSHIVVINIKMTEKMPSIVCRIPPIWKSK